MKMSNMLKREKRKEIQAKTKKFRGIMLRI